MRKTMMMVGGLSLVLLAPAWSQTRPASSATAAPASRPADAPLLQAVTVTGVRPGPGLWKVSKNGHLMWVLGTLTPLPRGMQWESDDVAQKLAQSPELLEAPSVPVKVDVGFFGKLFLLPSVYSARKNPDGQSLQQILPPPMYARWEALKPIYFGNDTSIEYWRPIVVALKLYQKALDKANLTNGNDIGKTVEHLADQLKVPREAVKYPLVIEHPRDALKVIKQTNLHDISCFNQTMDTVQRDMGALTGRANAWSTGDIDALRSANLSDRHASCVQAVLDASFAEQLGLKDIPQHLNTIWLAAAQAAIARNAKTFALLPMDQVMGSDGLLAQLKARGYDVQPPDPPAPEPSASTPAPASTPSH